MFRIVLDELQLGFVDEDAICVLERDIGAKSEPMTRNCGADLPNHAVWVRDGLSKRIIGILELVDAEEHRHVTNFVVSSDIEMQGLGSRLLKLAETEAQRMQFGISPFLNRQMASNLLFYEPRGYASTHFECIDELEIAFMAERFCRHETWRQVESLRVAPKRHLALVAVR